MLHTLALPCVDWHYVNDGLILRLNSMEMEPVTKAWAMLFISNFENCSNLTELINLRHVMRIDVVPFNAWC
jgi:hypothetical protein